MTGDAGTDGGALRALPGVDIVVRAMRQRSTAAAPHVAVEFARAAVSEAREAARSGGAAPALDAVVARALELEEAGSRSSLRPVINASGVLLQTNLGRAPLSARAIRAMEEIAARYSNLEYDLDAGRRGSRHDHGRALIRRVTGAEDGMVVNNNAAGLYFVLHALAAGRRVLVSRGEAVEIGGGFRIPEIVAQSGAVITEVGTTNRTYARDYAAAIDEDTALVLRVHSSNFRIVGFTAHPSAAELVALAREHGVLMVDDLGSGALIPTEQFGMAHEPMVQESVHAGADLVLFSGDKLLGGPQCGVIAGRADLIGRLRQHPLARVLRVDKLTLAALTATLLAYAEGSAVEEIPLWLMAALPEASVRARAERWVRAAGAGACVASETMMGGGSLPGESVPTWVAAIPGAPDAAGLASGLRAWATPIVARIEDGRVLLDPRTVDEGSDGEVARALATLVARAGQ